MLFLVYFWSHKFSLGEQEETVKKGSEQWMIFCFTCQYCCLINVNNIIVSSGSVRCVYIAWLNVQIWYFDRCSILSCLFTFTEPTAFTLTSRQDSVLTVEVHLTIYIVYCICIIMSASHRVNTVLKELVRVLNWVGTWYSLL